MPYCKDIGPYLKKKKKKSSLMFRNTNEPSEIYMEGEL